MPRKTQHEPVKQGSGRKRKKQSEPKPLSHNKSLFKFLIPKSDYLEDIRFGDVDIPFMLLVVVLIVFGLVMMYSASYAWAIHEGHESYFYFRKQLTHILIGLAFMLFFSSRYFDYHILSNKTINLAVFIVCIILMLLVHVPGIGIAEADAKRWIDLGFVSFQPSELMKIGMIMMYAKMMSSTRYRMDNFLFGIINPGIIIFIVGCLTVAQRHISATGIMLAITLVMIWVSGVKPKHYLTLIIILIIGGTAFGFILYKSGHFDYISDRFLAMINPFDEEHRDEVWQTRNSLIAIGSGGLFGLGFGNSRQKFLYLPESHNDFVFAIVCEELGFVGAAAVIILFLMLIFRGFSISENAPDKYGMLLSLGLVFQIGLQAILNIGVVSNALPNTGISLPFFSYGGTALILQMIEMGLVLNVSRQSIPKEEKQSESTAKELHMIQEAKNKLSH